MTMDASTYMPSSTYKYEMTEIPSLLEIATSWSHGDLWFIISTDLLYMVVLEGIRSLILAGTLGFGLFDPGSKVYSGWQLRRLPRPEKIEGGSRYCSCTDQLYRGNHQCSLLEEASLS